MGEALRQACQELWTLDQNRLTPGQDYVLNLQVRQPLGGVPRKFPHGF